MNPSENSLLEQLSWVDYCDQLSNQRTWPSAPLQKSAASYRILPRVSDAAMAASRPEPAAELS